MLNIILGPCAMLFLTNPPDPLKKCLLLESPLFVFYHLYCVYCSKWQAFKLASLSGFAEPLGVILVGMEVNMTNNLEILHLFSIFVLFCLTNDCYL